MTGSEMEPRGPNSLAPVSAVLPTFHRVEKLTVSLRAILACDPPPAEVIVHVDANDAITALAVARDFPTVRVLQSLDRVGPGGGRNRLVAACSWPIIASFDDDSYPMDNDYFAEAVRVLNDHKQVALVAAQIFHEGEVITTGSASLTRVADFVGCGCVFRKRAFLSSGGYVPLALAYGMEESDLSLRLQERGWSLLKSSTLRVFHATKLAHHGSAAITSASIANLALLAFLRYPISYWGIGVAQIMNRVAWLLRNGRTLGIVQGISSIPRHLWCHRAYRSVVSPATLRAHLKLRRTASELMM